MTDREFVEKIDFSFEITGNETGIRIQPFIDADIGCSRTLVASFQVDSLEMIESARIPLSPECTHVPFQQTVRIVKPLLWNPRGYGIPSLYKFTVAFHQKGAPFHLIEKQVGVHFMEICCKEKLFRINGKKVQLIRCEPDFAQKDVPQGLNSNGNLVFLNDSDPELKQKMEFCGRHGLIIALELTGNDGRLERLIRSPGICLFTAAAGSGGEKSYQSWFRSGMPPFFTHDELNSFVKDN